MGFSKVVAELAFKKPPPFVPSCLIASMKAIGARAMVCVTPLSTLWMVAGPARVWTPPSATKIIPATKAIGARTYMRQRVRSTQKFPMVGELRRENPRTNAMAATIPTAGVTNCCTVREPIWEKYDMVVSPP